MKGKMKLAVLGGLVLLLAGSAVADFNVQDKGTHYSNATSGQRTNSTGDLRSDDVNFGAYEVFDNIIANQLGASGVALQDSSQALETWKYKRLALTFTPQFDSLSTIVSVAVQVRAHFNNSVDSSSAFPWYRWPNRTAAVSDQDSVGHYTAGSYSLAQSTAANAGPSGGVWSGEFQVQFNVARQDTADGSGGLGKFGGYPKTIYLPLVDGQGTYFTAPYTSVRVRVLNGVRSRFRLHVKLVGMQ